MFGIGGALSNFTMLWNVLGQQRRLENLHSRQAPTAYRDDYYVSLTQMLTRSLSRPSEPEAKALAKIDDFVKAHGENFADGLFDMSFSYCFADAVINVSLNHRESMHFGMVSFSHEELTALIGGGLKTLPAMGDKLEKLFHKALGTPSPEERAEKTLREHLSSQQRETYHWFGWFTVVGNHTGRSYRIKKGRHSNIFILDKNGQDHRRICFTSRDETVPTADILLMQKLCLECDEDNTLRIANDQGPANYFGSTTQDVANGVWIDEYAEIEAQFMETTMAQMRAYDEQRSRN